MAERSKAPDSRKHLALKHRVFWSTNVGVGSNPTSDTSFKHIVISVQSDGCRNAVRDVD